MQGAPYSGKIHVNLNEQKMQYDIINDRPEERQLGEDAITPAAVLPNLAAFAVARGAPPSLVLCCDALWPGLCLVCGVSCVL